MFMQSTQFKMATHNFSKEAISRWQKSIEFCLDTALGRKMTKKIEAYQKAEELSKEETEELINEKLMQEYYENCLN